MLKKNVLKHLVIIILWKNDKNRKKNVGGDLYALFNEGQKRIEQNENVKSLQYALYCSLLVVIHETIFFICEVTKFPT